MLVMFLGCDPRVGDCVRVCSGQGERGQCQCRDGFVLSKYGNICEGTFLFIPLVHSPFKSFLSVFFVIGIYFCLFCCLSSHDKHNDILVV